MNADLVGPALALMREAGLDCYADTTSLTPIIEIRIGQPNMPTLRVSVDWELSRVTTSRGDELLLMSDWQDAISAVTEVARGFNEGRWLDEQGSSLIWGPWHRTIVHGHDAEYGFTKRFDRHPKKRGSSYVGSPRLDE
jgi:hypothetical protein